MSTAVRLVDANHPHKIWIDLDNSPHVPFFLPIIEELKKRGYDLLLTSRDNAQVLELLEYNNLRCRHYGRHYGKNKVIKVLGIGIRAMELAPLILRERPDLAVSHGSRSQIVLSSLLRIPSLAIGDYEHAKLHMAGIRPKWFMVPEVIAGDISHMDPRRTLKYPGIKEDVYVPRFRPAAGLRRELGLSDDDLVVTIRPPASDAHYHNRASDELFQAVVEFLGGVDGVRMVLLPRNKKQSSHVQQRWSHLFKSGKALIPARVVDGLNLIWFSDVVISAGGTMNREAAALGVPVYSIFRGKPAAVDRHLAATGRLVLLDKPEDVRTIRLDRRRPLLNPTFGDRMALSRIVENITSVLKLSCPACHAGRI